MNTLMQKKNSEGSKGYTLLFAVLITSIVLSVAISILSISRKEFVLSTSARESQFAFYAADSGLECASYQDLTLSAFNSTSTPTTLQCGAFVGDITVSPVTEGSGSVSTTTYTFSFPVSSHVTGAACTNVSVSKHNTIVAGVGTSTPSHVRSETIIIASGYNTGWNVPTSDCTFPSPKKVERQLKLTR